MKRFLKSQYDLLSAEGPSVCLSYNLNLLFLAARACKAALIDYELLSPSDLLKYRRTNTVFVFGSGYSLNDITPKEWAQFCQYDTIGFNAFVHQRWTPVSFHLIRGWGEGANVHYDWRSEVVNLANLINENPLYENTVILLQADHFAQVSKTLLAHRLLKKDTLISLYRTARRGPLPTTSLKFGLQHLSGTLSDTVNLAFSLGWQEIVLVGVDLYDTRYFWLKADETFCTDSRTGHRSVAHVSDRGQRFDEAHSTVRNGVVEEMRLWQSFMELHGVRLSVYNPRSLLAEVLPVYNFPVI
jgi:hypothetical protein